MRVKKKYILHPGFVSSKNDGDLHYVNCHELSKCYKVNIKECFLDLGENSMKGIDQSKFINLYPREDGNYTL